MFFLFIYIISTSLAFQTCVTVTNINCTEELFNDLQASLDICHETDDCKPAKTTVQTFFDPAEEHLVAVSILESCTLPVPSTSPATSPTGTTPPTSGIQIDWATAGAAAGLVLAFLTAVKISCLILGYITQVPDIRHKYRRAGRTTTNESELI